MKDETEHVTFSSVVIDSSFVGFYIQLNYGKPVSFAVKYTPEDFSCRYRLVPERRVVIARQALYTYDNGQGSVYLGSGVYVVLPDVNIHSIGDFVEFNRRTRRVQNTLLGAIHSALATMLRPIFSADFV